MTHKRKKNDNLDVIKIKNYCMKDINKTIKKKQKKLMFDKELVSKIYNTWLLKTTLKIKIQEWKMNRVIENGKIAEWQIIIWIYYEHRLPLGNWKLKQQWDITTYLSKWLKFKTLTIIECWNGCGAKGFIHLLLGCKMVQLLWKIVWQLLTKLNVVLSYDSPISLRGIYLIELKNYAHTKTCALMFIVTSFILAIAESNQDVLQWVNGHKLWYILTMKYYSVIKRCELVSHKKFWRNLNAYC